MSLLPGHIPSETSDERIARLERELAAGRRNHTLLVRSRDQVIRNNDRLRTGIVGLLDDLPDDPDLAPLVEKLEDALAMPLAYERAVPGDDLPEDDVRPTDAVALAAFLTTALNAIGRSCHLVQEACTPIVWNSEAIRLVLRELTDELAPEDEDEDGDPATPDTALMASIVDGIARIQKAGADPKV